MHNLTFSLTQLTYHNRDGSFETQADRLAMLKLIGNHLVEEGYAQLRPARLARHHGFLLVARWQAEGIADTTIRNRLAVMRWWAKKVGRAGVIPDNAAFGLAPRHEVAQVSRAQTLPDDKLSQIRDPFVRMSLELQRAFGLRREESIKIRPRVADGGHELRLRGSWCKGGRARVVPIVTAAQREVLERAKALVQTQDASLIPPVLTYIQQEKRYEDWTRRVGLSKMHGLRHQYAAEQFTAHTGLEAPVQGGPHSQELTAEQRATDHAGRLAVSAALGHSRKRITSNYLGR